MLLNCLNLLRFILHYSPLLQSGRLTELMNYIMKILIQRYNIEYIDQWTSESPYFLYIINTITKWYSVSDGEFLSTAISGSLSSTINATFYLLRWLSSKYHKCIPNATPASLHISLFHHSLSTILQKWAQLHMSAIDSLSSSLFFAMQWMVPSQLIQCWHE